MITQMVNPLDKYQRNGIGGYEQKKEIETPKFSMEEVLKSYEKVLSEEVYNDTTGKEVHNRIRRHVKQVFSPLEIRIVSSGLPVYSKLFPDSDYEFKTGAFITALIQKSYDKGYNDFTIDQQNNLNCIGFRLRAHIWRPLRLTFNGDFETVNQAARNLNVKVNGTVKYLGGKYCVYDLRKENIKAISYDTIADIEFYRTLKHNKVTFDNGKEAYIPGVFTRLFNNEFRESTYIPPWMLREYKEPGRLKRALIFFAKHLNHL